MNHKTLISLTLISLIGLTACDDKHNNAVKNLSSHAPTEIILPPDDQDDDKEDDKKDDEDTPPVADCEAIANPITPFTRLQTYYGSLLGQPHINSETGGLLPLTLTHDAAEGDLILQLDSTVALVPGQLITYHAKNFDFYAARIARIEGNTITLDERGAVVSGIEAGQKLWNFYNDPTHPNIHGFNAIADYAYRSTARMIEAGKTHVLLGDSWFNLDGIEARLALRYPNATFINQGIGGNNLCDLLARFDTDVAPQAPDYVWVNSSINDYYANVTQDVYKLRLQNLIAKIQATGAKAIVFDPAPLDNGRTADGVDYLTLSQRYASQVLALYEEALEQ